jgi:hypothetical protein
MSTIIDIQAVGRIACELCCSVQIVKRAAAALKIAPAFRINGVDHYPADCVEQIADMVRELQKQKRK